jgi:hypothetical protein
VGGINVAKFGRGDRDVYRLFLFLHGSLAGIFFIQKKEAEQKERSMIGIVFPLVILAISVLLTFYLYRHFSRKL